MQPDTGRAQFDYEDFLDSRDSRRGYDMPAFLDTVDPYRLREPAYGGASLRDRRAPPQDEYWERRHQEECRDRAADWALSRRHLAPDQNSSLSRDENLADLIAQLQQYQCRPAHAAMTEGASDCSRRSFQRRPRQAPLDGSFDDPLDPWRALSPVDSRRRDSRAASPLRSPSPDRSRGKRRLAPTDQADQYKRPRSRSPRGRSKPPSPVPAPQSASRAAECPPRSQPSSLPSSQTSASLPKASLPPSRTRSRSSSRDSSASHASALSASSSPTKAKDDYNRPAATATIENADPDGLLPFSERIDLVRQHFSAEPVIIANPARVLPPRNPVGMGIILQDSDPLPSLPFAPTRAGFFQMEQRQLEGHSTKGSDQTVQEPMGVGKFPRRPHFNHTAYRATDQPEKATASLPGAFRAIQKAKSKDLVSYTLLPQDVLDWERRLRHMTSMASVMDWTLGTCISIVRILIEDPDHAPANIANQLFSLLHTASKAGGHIQQAQVSMLSSAILHRRDAFIATLDSDVSGTTRRELRSHDLASETLFSAETCVAAKKEVAEAAQVRLNDQVKQQSARTPTAAAKPSARSQGRGTPRQRGQPQHQATPQKPQQPKQDFTQAQDSSPRTYKPGKQRGGGRGGGHGSYGRGRGARS